MIQLRSVVKGYPGKTRVLDQVQLQMKKGDFLYVLGGTGAGKSTLLRMLATEEHASQGSVQLFGYDLATANSDTVQAIRRSIGYIPQSISLISDFSVYENVALGVSFGGSRVLRADVRKRIFELLDRLQLSHLRDQSAARLSGGEAQRVSIARALARQPELIVADEPTGAQDQAHTWAIMDLVQKYNVQGTTVVVATHDREMVRRVRKRCAILHQGRMILEEATVQCSP